MTKLAWKPWHQVVQLRDDLKSGELSLNQFAADLYEVLMQRGERPIYENPEEFFALTYPTYNLRQLAREVVLRLAGKNDKAVRQLALTYGGGKTHTLITLNHLVADPEHLPDLPAVHEFVTEIGMTPPKARVAALCADKLDVEKGMEVRSPCGETRWLKQPWSVLAYQIAGDEGLKVLSATGSAEERESAPAENLLQPLLALPAKEGLGDAGADRRSADVRYGEDRPCDRSGGTGWSTSANTSPRRRRRWTAAASWLRSWPATRERPTGWARKSRENCTTFSSGSGRKIVEPVVKQDVAEVLAPPLLQARVDPRRGRVPPPRRRGPEGHHGRGPADPEGWRGGRGEIPGKLPVPPRPDRGPVLEMDPVGAVPADPWRLADLRPGPAGGREMGPMRR